MGDTKRTINFGISRASEVHRYGEFIALASGKIYFSVLSVIKHQTVNSQNHTIMKSKSVLASKICLRQLFATRDESLF